MKKSLLFLVVAASLGLLLAYERPHPYSNQAKKSTTESSNQTDAPTRQSNNEPPQIIPTVSTKSLKDGNFNGSLETNEYETVQVSIKVSAGKITEIDVPVLDYTYGGRSIRVVESALPTLKKSAIDKQSSDIDYVSGATLISISFKDSLQTAITSAKT